MAFKGGDSMNEIVKFGVEGALIVGDSNLSLGKLGNGFLKARKGLGLLVSTSFSHGRKINESTKLIGTKKRILNWRSGSILLKREKIYSKNYLILFI